MNDKRETETVFIDALTDAELTSVVAGGGDVTDGDPDEAHKAAPILF